MFSTFKFVKISFSPPEGYSLFFPRKRSGISRIRGVSWKKKEKKNVVAIAFRL